MDVTIKTDNFIDEWMSSSSANKLVSDTHLVSDVSKTTQNSLGKRTGVRDTKSKNVKNDNLLSRLENQAVKNQKQHKKKSSDLTNENNDNDDDDIGIQLHGIIETHEESKLSSINKKQKVSQTTDIKTNNTKSENKVDKIIGSNETTHKPNTNQQNYNTVFNSDSKMNNTNSNSNHTTNNKNEYKNTSYNHESDTNMPNKFKRKKCRSKQKNIRKDNRPDDAKPEYLRLDSEIYRGRELTKVILIFVAFSLLSISELTKVILIFVAFSLLSIIWGLFAIVFGP